MGNCSLVAQIARCIAANASGVGPVAVTSRGEKIIWISGVNILSGYSTLPVLFETPSTLHAKVRISSLFSHIYLVGNTFPSVQVL